MMSDLMREEFEKEWGFTNEEQGLSFVPELNIYGCELYLNSGTANRKSSAWFYFQKGWQASRESLAVELPNIQECCSDGHDWSKWMDPDDVKEAIHAAGVKTK